MYKQINSIYTNINEFSVVGCFITLLFICLHSPYPSSQTTSWSTFPRVSWLFQKPAINNRA